MADTRTYISQVKLPGDNTTYYVKDSVARDMISALQGVTFHKCTTAADTPYGVTWDSAGTTITGTLTAVNADKSYIYLVASKHTQTRDIYDEYIPVNEGTEADPSWVWETLGNTDLDIDDLGDLAYKDTASGSGTVSTADSAAFSNGAVSASATYTPAGSVSVTLAQTATAATLTKGDYTPAGTVSKPNVTITPTSVTIQSKKTNGSVTAGTAASFTSGSFSGGSFSQGSDSFVAPSWSASVADEVLTFSFSAGSFTQGTDTYTPASHGADTFTANTPTAVTLPTFEEKSALSAVSAELDATPTFTGTKATNALVTGVTYDKATVESSTFSGTQATISSTGTATGDVTLTKTSKTVNVTVS